VAGSHRYAAPGDSSRRGGLATAPRQRPRRSSQVTSRAIQATTTGAVALAGTRALGRRLAAELRHRQPPASRHRTSDQMMQLNYRRRGSSSAVPSLSSWENTAVIFGDRWRQILSATWRRCPAAACCWVGSGLAARHVAGKRASEKPAVYETSPRASGALVRERSLC